METEELLLKRFRELAAKCYQNSQYTFTSFLSMGDMAGFYQIEKELSYVPYTVWGGSELCERVMVRFGSEEQLGYTEEFPIVCLQVKPLAAKFADPLTHRDFLGAIMNLGIERSTVGDIFILDNIGYIFCMEKIAPFLMENLSSVKHTSIICSQVKEVPALQEGEKQEIIIQIASERIDGVIAKVYKLSRSEAIELFAQKKVFVNGRLCESNSRLLKEADRVSTRGCGKFEYLGSGGLSKKGKLNARILLYGNRKK